VEGKEHADRALAGGRGLIFIIPHLGNWELLNHYLGKAYGLTHMYQPNPSADINGMIQAWREGTGTRFVEADRAGIRAQLEALRCGRAIGAMPDQEPGVHTGQFADFFGVACLTNTLIPNLARRTGAACILAWCERLDNGAGFRVMFEPLSLPGTREACLAALNCGIERAVRSRPEQYLWSYKRFRTRPAGELERYQFRQHPARVAVEATLCRGLFALCNALPLRALRLLGRAGGDGLGLLRSRYARVARINLELCSRQLAAGDILRLRRECLRELAATGLETGKLWRCGDVAFDNLLPGIEGAENMPDPGGASRGTIVLTPPLGNREAVMRWLGRRYPATEYYHPRADTALDDAVRRQRSTMGIALVPHCEESVDVLASKLADGEIAILCPDQQPRLRGGIFVPFFGVAALTSLALARLIRETGAPVVLAAAIREDTGFRLCFQCCEFAPDLSDAGLLTAINRQLEETIGPHAAQYRWSDKRFNIRSRGEPGVYR